MKKLKPIIEKYGSDKSISGYDYYYDRLFSPFIGSGINYLEIGLGTLIPTLPSTFIGNIKYYSHYKPAAILKVWREYFENAVIHGIDIGEDCMLTGEQNIQTSIIDSTNAIDCVKFLEHNMYDIILDDGLHTSDGQLATIKNFFNSVKDNGLYIIEDCGSDGKNIFIDYKDEVLSIIGNNSYMFGTNILFIYKDSANRGELSFKDLCIAIYKDKKQSILHNIINFTNNQVEPTIINRDQCFKLVEGLATVIVDDIEGDVVELGCNVGESSKYLRKTLDILHSDKKLWVYDSFEGLPEKSMWEEGTGWRSGTLKTTKDVLVTNFISNNLLPPDNITKAWFADIQDSDLPDKISFAFLDGDFYNSIYDSLVKIYDRVVDGGYIYLHDYCRNDLPGVKAAMDQFLVDRGVKNTTYAVCEQLGLFIKTSKSLPVETTINIPVNNSIKNFTIVSGLWDIGREGREWSEYKKHFDVFLKIPCNMVLFIPESLESYVLERRSRDNTLIKIYELEDIKNLYLPFWDQTQQIRTSRDWVSQVSWLCNSPQYKNEYYNPIVMSKMFMLNDASLWNPFDTEYFYWLDAGITNTVNSNYFTHENVLDKLNEFSNPFLFLSYPYDAVNEIHGFDYSKICEYSDSKVDYVCRGGLFGGHKQQLHKANAAYYSLLDQSLNEGLMGTEESLFTIMSYLEPDVYRRYELDSNGLIVKFAQALHEDNVTLAEPSFKRLSNTREYTDRDVINVKTNLYMLTFNFPEQVLHTIESMKKTPEWLNKPSLFLLDNSTNEDAKIRNQEIAKEYNFEYIDLGSNTGICGGRQAAAVHFDKSNADFMFFFEDDMTSNPPELQGEFCRNGLRKYIPNLYNIVHKAMLKNEFDFLKLSFTEVYFDNDKQCSWYNVPQEIRTRDWPDYDKLPTTGLDPNCPRTNFDKILTTDDVAYITGEIYYANWPMIVSKEGNKKMFIDTKWSYPFEQTWMSHMYQLTKEDKLKPAVLLASPIWHDRIMYYEPDERREN